MFRLRWTVPFLCIALLPLGGRSRGQNSPKPPAAQPDPPECPWLTAGSAAHALHGQVHVTVSLKDKSHGVCIFSPLAKTTLDEPRSELSISIGGNEVKSCPKDSPTVAGIGSFAYLCSIDPSKQDPQRMISGAVREKHFAVVMKKESPTSSALTAELKQVSEIVAGNLF